MRQCEYCGNNLDSLDEVCTCRSERYQKMEAEASAETLQRQKKERQAAIDLYDKMASELAKKTDLTGTEN